MSADCLFCKIAAKKIPSKILYEDDDVFAFEDIGPQAPTHILICPRKHIASLNEATPEDQAVLGKLQLVAAQLARKLDLLEGYRTVLNNGKEVVGLRLVHCRWAEDILPHVIDILLRGGAFQNATDECVAVG